MTSIRKNTNILLKDDVIGERGELGEKLLLGVISNVKECDIVPSNIFLINRAVFLSTTNENAIYSLKELHNIGVKIFSCGTCLDFFNLRDKLQVGEVGNAKDILEALLSQDSITL
ncbi:MULTISPECIES: sulfurtransferase-like selenium metabolism protein YedF [Helicobacter]|uniref:Sulfurtransferase-like selenium metabolism protein YedF n=1 Tax=Helicobacter ibis TaxID=2962633 RepID=A0ABT4VC42_9HELI|nr:MULTISPECIES: sulfurtransferase-like selenium metabolism protein YedF [Helicobacter]MDA3967521.1 sulfurtransferase-like selenium metabolism protein YedF [Helicobacter sp. WB40]MDA3968269.1 sulfurtransferase-like selenium metabolism protein YedF [Helicobacter ibis]